MSGKRKPPVVTSPFEDSRMDTPQTQDDNSKLLFSNEPETEDVSPLNDLHADLGRGLQARRSLSSPDLASLAAEPEQSVEHAPPSIFQAGTPRSDQGAVLGPRRSVSMPDGHYLRMWSNSELISLAERMQQGLHVRDRVYHFKKYPNSFTGADAVRWIVSNGLAGSEGEALLLGNDMLHAGLLHHVKFKRPFQNNGNLYRFLDVRSGASDVTDGNETGSSPSSQAEADEFARFERLYDEMWARRGVQKMNKAVPLLGTQHEGWSTAAELAQLQRKVADLAAELEEYKALNDLMRDSMTLQLQNGQQLFALLQSRLERAIRRGTWIALQLLAVWVLLLVLASLLAENFLSQQPPTFLNSLAQAAVPLLAVLCALSALSWQPWQLPAAKKLLEAGPAAVKPTTPAAEESPESEGPGVWRVDLGADAMAEGREKADEVVQLCALSKEDAQKLQQPPLEQDLSGWPDDPLLLRAAPLPSLHMQPGVNPCAIQINDGRRIEFQTDLFRGCAVIWAQGLSSSPEGLFAGERRKTSITVQGRFKQNCAVEDIVSGQEFARQPKNLPAMWLVDKVLIKLAKKISPSMDIGPLSAPYLLAPVLALAQLVNVSHPGEEPDPSQPTPEDLRLFDPSLTNNSGGPMDALKRKKHFWNKRNRAGHSFTREHVWTFQMYQHFVDMGAYELNMIYGFDLGRHLDGQPLQFMLKDRRRGDYLMNFHAWHRKLLPAAQAAEKRPGGDAAEEASPQ